MTRAPQRWQVLTRSLTARSFCFWNEFIRQNGRSVVPFFTIVVTAMFGSPLIKRRTQSLGTREKIRQLISPISRQSREKCPSIMAVVTFSGTSFYSDWHSERSEKQFPAFQPLISRITKVASSLLLAAVWIPVIRFNVVKVECAVAKRDQFFSIYAKKWGYMLKKLGYIVNDMINCMITLIWYLTYVNLSVFEVGLGII